MDNSKSNTKPKIIKAGNGKFLKKDGEIASKLNPHFDKNKIAQLHRRRHTLPRITDSGVFDSVDEQEMKSVIDNLDVGKSAGHDGLPAKAVKVCKGLFKSYLTNRKQCVRIGDEISDTIPMIMGIASSVRFSSIFKLMI
jgi:hypothetical protein